MDELNKVLYRALMTALGHDPDTKYTFECCTKPLYTQSTKPPVRRTWPKAGQPDWGVEDDVLFFSITDTSGDDVIAPVHEQWENAQTLTRIQTRTRVLQVQLTAYGARGYDNLLQIRHAFSNGSKILRDAGLYFIPEAIAPNYAPELFQGMWWKRADLTLRFNSELTFIEPVGVIETVPVDITANTSSHTTHDTGIIIKKG